MIFLSGPYAFLLILYFRATIADGQASAYLEMMANGLKPLARFCALYLACVGCGSGEGPDTRSTGPVAGTTTQSGAASSGAGTIATSAGEGGTATAGSGGAPPSNGPSASAGTGGQSDGPPPALDGRSIYALECHGDSKDCNLATVPCLGVSSQTPNVAAGWACANRCTSNADCSDAPSGAEARPSCVSFSSTGHCMLVCKNEDTSFACPAGMQCFIPERSPLGYCLWQ